ncbi:MAG TPA: hypothetical protein P5268_01835 [Candidatus Marinimicrobia bacterium]|nr:hypothetical protein [Candidatus Neomarinimicrobiota bacterium]HRS50903.1 hypothetical protein [Candidatus Neomarinimicrobiota bacterium]HRU91755.1 hypothetical protein [Candidatus Neomarinimicrobiota bacterium]
MKEILQVIIDEEKSARERIENARLQARRATEAAQIEAQKTIETARQSALQEAEAIISTAKSEAAREHTELLNAARARQNDLFNQYHSEITAAVDFLFQTLPIGKKVAQ